MSRLLENSKEYREQLLAKNFHSKENEYQIGNTRALSDGDEKGKGENNGSVGSATDIQKRNELIAKNKFSRNNEYDISNA